MNNRSIGVFDSGLGGLTVLKEIIELMPGESIVYFGDNGRAPYGTKSKDVVIKYTLQDMRFLLSQDVKMIVIACNTASALSLDSVKENFNIPIIEVIKPGAMAGIKHTNNKKIGIIGTTATINSGAYEKAINSLDTSIKVFSKACPLFVPLAEEGPKWWEHDITYQIAMEYLVPLKEEGIDTLVLGCTHYPLLKKVIGRVMGEDVSLVNSASEVARVVKSYLEEVGLESDNTLKPMHKYYTSDSVEKFEPLCNAILNNGINFAEKVDIEIY